MSEWFLTVVLAIGLAVVLGVVGGYVSARWAVIGCERRLDRSRAQEHADLLAVRVPARV